MPESLLCGSLLLTWVFAVNPTSRAGTQSFLLLAGWELLSPIKLFMPSAFMEQSLPIRNSEKAMGMGECGVAKIRSLS